eukprot:jgi/Mesen1/2072/ME000151S01337
MSTSLQALSPVTQLGNIAEGSHEPAPVFQPLLLLHESTPAPPVVSHDYAGTISDKDSSVVTLQRNGFTVGAAEETEEQKCERKKRSKNWTRAETLELIKFRSELDERFSKSGRKGELWEELAEKLQQAGVSRDVQQCRDKWEKLIAGYKDVRDGLKDRVDNAFFDQLHALLAEKCQNKLYGEEGGQSREFGGLFLGGAVEGTLEGGETVHLKKKKKLKPNGLTDYPAIQSLLETVVNKQQRLMQNVLDAMEKREQARVEREERWRAEERAQRAVFNNAFLELVRRATNAEKMSHSNTALGGEVGMATNAIGVGQQSGLIGGKKRSKNWRRSEVLALIKVRGDMDNHFLHATRRVALWEEVSKSMAALGVFRDGKQCREKWDKLTADYKDVFEGKKDQGESPYYLELVAVMANSVGFSQNMEHNEGLDLVS